MRIKGSALSHHRRLTVALCAVLAVTTGCADPTTGGSGSDQASSAESIQLDKDPEAAKLVPEEYRERGYINFGALLTGAPMMSMGESGDIVAAERELIDVVGQVLGLEVKTDEVTTDGFIPAIQSGRVDLVAGSLTDIKEREAQVDFVVYAEYGQALLSTAENAEAVSFDSLCGQTVAVAKGSIQQLELLPEVEKQCKADVEPSPVGKAFPDANALYLAVNSGRVDAGFLNEVTIRYQADQSNGEMAVADTGFGTDLKGIAIGKDSGLVEPVLAAVKVAKKEGALDKIFKKYAIKATLLPTPQVNAAVR